MDSVRQAVRSITVEPVLFLFMTGSFMQYTAFQSLMYDKVCLGQYSRYVCDHLDLDQYKQQKDKVQELSSYWLLWSNVALSVPSAVAAIVLGTWSDLLSRKVPLVIPPLGQLLAAVVYMVMSAFQTVPVSLVVLANFIAGVTGGFTSGIMAVMAYLAAVTSVRARTVRVGRLESMTFLGGCIGPFLGSAVFENWGRTWTFCCLLLVNALCVLYAVLVVPEVPPPDSHAEVNKWQLVKTQIVRLRFVLDALATVVKWRPDSRRTYIISLLLCSFVIMLNTTGENDVTYLYIKDAPLSLPDRIYSYYFGLRYALGCLALMVLLPLFRRFADPDDFTVCGVGLFFKIVALIWLSLSQNQAMLFIAPVFGMLNTFCIPPIRSHLSKLVAPDEQGRIYSLVTIVESLCTLFGSMMYNGIYPATRRLQQHGVVFLVGASTLLIPAGLLVWLRCKSRRQGAHAELTEEPPPTAQQDKPATDQL